MNPILIIFIVALLVLLTLLFVWLYMKKKSRKAAAGGAPSAGGDEAGMLIRDANAKLAASRGGKGKRIGTSPVFLLMGDSGTAKTSTMLQSGLDPELLAGQLYADGSVVATGTANLWFTRNAVFVEAGGALASDQRAWSRLAARLRPASSVLGRGQQAPRAVIVCFDCENFTRDGARQAVADSARRLRDRLIELATATGIRLPVYVLFTKIDKLRFFTEYVRNLTNEEATQVLGATLPLAAGQAEGVYAEQQTARLTGEFEQLFRSLAGFRLEFLPRETEGARTPAVYEFPREFRKIRALAVQFLVDLCRPSQLSAGPFLRGFYFSGVRPIVTTEAAPAAAASPAPAASYGGAEATTIFRPDMRAQAASVAARQPVSRRMPQWLFLTQLFSSVFLNDRIAMSVSGVTAGRRLARRVLYGSAAAVCLLLTLAFTISFFNNRGLESQVREAAAAIGQAGPAGADVAPLDSLRRLDALRQALANLIAYRKGAPWSYRWGLYTGDALLPEARRVYFERFRQLQFSQTQDELLRFLRGLPGANPESNPTYNALKAYLITTSHPEKSTLAFLPPELMKWWSYNRSIDADRSQLGRKQFEFYAEELPAGNPFPGEGDALAVQRARQYLTQLGGSGRVYAFMLAEVSKRFRPVNFNARFPGSVQTVVEPYEVQGAFSKDGWTAMQDAIAHADRYVGGELWVVGEQSAAKFDRAQLDRDLKASYSSDFLKEWRTYIKSASVVRYASVKDAAQKLMQLSGPQSALLELMALASQNTAVDDPGVGNVFQPVQAVVPPATTDRFIGPTNQSYMDALLALQSAVDGVANLPAPNEAAVAPALDSAQKAKIAALQLGQKFSVDAGGHVEAAVQKLLTDPITYAEAVLRPAGTGEVNGKGKALCAQFRPVMGKFPFNPNADAEATLPEVNGLFRRPDGAFWKLYEESLQKALVKQGAQYVANPGGGISLTPAFVSFFNAAAAFSDALYAGNAQDPHFTYTLVPEPTDAALQVRFDGETMTYAGGKGTPKQFTWRGTGPHEANVTVKFGNSPDFSFPTTQGTWAVFHFFEQAEQRLPAGQNETFVWVLRTGKKNEAVTVNGKPVEIRLTVDMNGGPRIFDRGYFAHMGCVAELARQ